MCQVTVFTVAFTGSPQCLGVLSFSMRPHLLNNSLQTVYLGVNQSTAVLLPRGSLSAGSISCGQPRPENIKWKIPEAKSACGLNCELLSVLEWGLGCAAPSLG